MIFSPCNTTLLFAFLCYIFILDIFPQTSVKMSSSGRRTLSKEALEVHNLLSPASGTNTVISEGHACTSKTSETIKLQPRLSNVLNIQDLSAVIRDSVISGVKDGLALSLPIVKEVPSQPKRKRSVDSSLDKDLPLPGSDDVHEVPGYPDGVFGEDVNSDPDEEDVQSVDSVDHGLSPPDDTPQVPKAPNEPPIESISVDPDSDLPNVSPRAPPTWAPKEKVMNWVKLAIDKEFSAEDRKKINEKFHGKEEYDELLLPPKMHKKIYKAIKAPATKKKDFLFNRQEVEKNLYNASSDLCSSIRPLIEAISLLDGMPEGKEIKNLVGQGLQGIFSANIKISRSRREVGRRFVRTDCAEALFSVAPTHSSLFGGPSVTDAVKQAKESSKLDDSLVYAPPPKKPFRGSSSSVKGFLRGSRYSQTGFRQDTRYQDSQARSPRKWQSKGKSRGNYKGKRGGKSSRKTSSKD